MSRTAERRADAASPSSDAGPASNVDTLRVLVLGSGGQLGTDVVRAASGFERLRLTPCTRAQLDLADTNAIHEVLGAAEFDVILNCAGCNRTTEAERDPRDAFAVNARAVGAIAALCRERAARLVHVSSDYVFDGVFEGTHPRPYTERDAVRPLNVYGASKALGETLARHWLPEVVVVRTASLFGIGASGARTRDDSSNARRNFVEAVIARAQAGEAFDVVDDITMSPTSSADLARALLTLVERNVPGGLYHVVNSGPATWHELAYAAVEAAGGDPALVRRTHANDADIVRPRYSVLDNSLVGSIIGPMRPWREALADYMEARGGAGAHARPDAPMVGGEEQ